MAAQAALIHVHLILINPNTSVETTEMMVAVARASNPGIEIDGVTAPFGVPIILNPTDLAAASRAVNDLRESVRKRQPDGVIVAAFGDPGVAQLRRALPCPVTGIAQASMAVAAERGGRFAVVTTTPDLVETIRSTAESYGYGGSFVGTSLTRGEPAHIMADRVLLEAAMELACRHAITDLAADVIIIGGGPLAVVAQALRKRFEIPIIEPVSAAVRVTIARVAGG